MGGLFILFERKENETEEELIYRICKQKDEIGTWQEVANILNELLNYQYTESRYRKQWQGFNRLLAANKDSVKEEIVGDNVASNLNDKIRELQLERKKIQTEKTEYNRYLREEARDELIIEKIRNAIISEYNPRINVSNNFRYDDDCDRVGVLCFGDEHYGANFEIKGLCNEIINSYSPEIFEQRMELLLNETIRIVEKEKLSRISVYSMGDFTDGVLRVKQLFTLKYGVIEGTVRYAKYIVCNINRCIYTVYLNKNLFFFNRNNSFNS